MGIEKDDRINIDELCFYACTVWGERIFFCTERTDLLMEFDLQSQIIHMVENEKWDKDDGNIADFLAITENKLYKLQRNGNRIIEYSLETKKAFAYEIGEETKEWGNFSYMEIYGQYLYLFPKYVEKTIVFDLETRSIVSNKSFWGEIKEHNFDVDTLLLRKGCKVFGKFVLLFSKRSQFVFVYNLESNHYEVKKVPDEVVGIVALHQAGDKLYILDTKSRLFEWDRERDSMRFMFEIAEINDEDYFSKIVVTDINIVLLPLLGNDIYIYDRNTKKIFIYKDYPKDFSYFGYETWGKYVEGCTVKDTVYFPMRKSKYILKIEKTTGNILWIKPIAPLKEERIQYYKEKGIKSFREGKCLLNESEVDLNGYISIIETL